MTNKFRLTGTLLTTVLLAGCIGSPADYETTPVKVQTDKGVVICQLYTPQTVLWDRSIDRPTSMTIDEADDICRARGKQDQ